MIVWDDNQPNRWSGNKYGAWIIVCDYCGIWSTDYDDPKWHEVVVKNEGWIKRLFSNQKEPKSHFCPHCSSRNSLAELMKNKRTHSCHMKRLNSND